MSVNSYFLQTGFTGHDNQTVILNHVTVQPLYSGHH